MTFLHRRHVLVLVLAAPLAGCSARGPAALPGWDRVIVGDLSLRRAHSVGPRAGRCRHRRVH